MQQRQKHSKTSYSWRALCIRLIFPKPLFKIWYPIFWVCVQWFPNFLWIDLINFPVIHGDWYPLVFWLVFNNHQISSKICHNSWSIRRYIIITFLYANKFQSLFSWWEIFEQFLHIALRTNITRGVHSLILHTHRSSSMNRIPARVFSGVRRICPPLPHL